ncbi:hypothetical protein HNR72_007897 [Streptomyces collinus]|uniref:Uncharacterized protein n=1 Tax=Streptomyces collinus TaxID=42684 RepID=A0AA89TZI8_STRCU|nr:hypothetical protein [Streptomyces collinus]
MPPFLLPVDPSHAQGKAICATAPAPPLPTVAPTAVTQLSVKDVTKS